MSDKLKCTYGVLWYCCSNETVLKEEGCIISRDKVIAGDGWFTRGSV